MNRRKQGRHDNPCETYADCRLTPTADLRRLQTYADCRLTPTAHLRRLQTYADCRLTQPADTPTLLRMVEPEDVVFAQDDAGPSLHHRRLRHLATVDVTHGSLAGYQHHSTCGQQDEGERSMNSWLPPSKDTNITGPVDSRYGRQKHEHLANS